jgi:predicted Rossmann fold flavoprotein
MPANGGMSIMSKMKGTRSAGRLQGRQWDVAVIGAGPAGLAAAIFAARTARRGAQHRAGRSVLLIERMPRPGRKLLATGGGRCNVTNASESSAMCAAFGDASRFVRPAITSFCGPDLLAFLSSLGVECSAADGFHYYPRSESAREVLDALLEACRASGVEVLIGCRVTAIEADSGRVVALRTDKGLVSVRAAILAAGGQSYPALGSDGSGFDLVEALGGRVIAPVPALAGLKVKERWVRALAGVAVSDVVLSVPTATAKTVRTRGELLFTHEGLSGSAALDASRIVSRSLLDRPWVEVRIDVAPAVSREAIESAILAAAAASGRRFARTEVARLLPSSLAQALCALAGASDTPLAALTTRARKSLLRAVKECQVRVTGTDGFDKAMVTSGGVDRAEVSPRTLESARVRGLFFAGEVVDVDGPCGGYNLQWAFSSGRLAGLSAAGSADPSS